MVAVPICLKSLQNQRRSLHSLNFTPINSTIMKRTWFVFIAFFLFFGFPAHSQNRIDKKLQQKLISMAKNHNGKVGFYIKNLKSGKVAMYNADSIFPTASIVKLPILVGVMDKVEKGELKYNQELIYKDSLYYAGVDILGSFKENEKIELSKVIMLMLTMSDNTASLWLQSLAGGGAQINKLMEAQGLQQFFVNSRTPGREANRQQYGWGQTTPREAATLFERLVNGQVINKQASEKMLRLLSRNYWDENALSSIPAGVFVASKNGAVNASRSEVMFVNGKKAPYIFAFFTNENKDQSWRPDNEALKMLRDVSAEVWNRYN